MNPWQHIFSETSLRILQLNQQVDVVTGLQEILLTASCPKSGQIFHRISAAKAHLVSRDELYRLYGHLLVVGASFLDL